LFATHRGLHAVDVGDDDLSALASQIADYDRDIAPDERRAAARLAALRVPPPQPQPPTWQRLLYWLGVWRLHPDYQGWARWEPEHSKNFVMVRVGVSALALLLVEAATLMAAAPGYRHRLWARAIAYVVVGAGWQLYQLDIHPGRARRRWPRVGTPSENGARLTYNTLRIGLVLALLVVAVTLAHAM